MVVCAICHKRHRGLPKHMNQSILHLCKACRVSYDKTVQEDATIMGVIRWTAERAWASKEKQ